MSDTASNFTECYVAFLDIMGMKSLVKDCETNTARYQNIVEALNEAKNSAGFYSGTRNLETGEQADWQAQIHAFSDSVCLFIPTQSKTLPWLLATVRKLHDRLVRQEVCMRGAITIGGMHWDSSWVPSFLKKTLLGSDSSRTMPNIAFGPGLVEAYLLEDGVAQYPRILISEKLVEHTKQLQEHDSPQVFPLAQSGRLLDYFRRDADGLYHFDVLHSGLNRQEVVKQTEIDDPGRHGIHNDFNDTTFAEYLEMVRTFIEQGYAAVEGEKLAAKYMWLANYYNEKANDSGGKLIPWFENLIPTGVSKLTIKQKSPSVGD